MTLKFESEFKIIRFAFSLNGAKLSASQNQMWIVKFAFMNIVSGACFIFLINSIIFYDVPNAKYSEAIKNGSMAILYLIICFKYFVLFRHQNSFKELIKNINEDYSTTDQLTSEEKKIVLQYSRKGKNVCKFWLITTFPSGALFPLKALYFMIYSCYQGQFKLVPMFDMTYPKLIETRKDCIYMFLFLFFLCFIFDLFAVTMYIGFDSLFPIFMLHICGQLEILCQRIETVLSRAKTEKEIHENLKKINQKLQSLYRFVYSVQLIFTELFEISMKTSIFLMPFCAFQIVQSLRHFELNEFLCFFVVCVFHFFMPCYYGNLVQEKGNRLREAIYSCGWENHPSIEIRKTVLFMLTRCSIPINIRTIFHPVDLATFSEACNQAYTIFSIMNAAWT